MKTLNLKPTHKHIKDYYEEISNLSGLGVHHEGAVSPAFSKLLSHCAHQFSQTLIEKQAKKVDKGTIFIDGAIVDIYNLPHGFWEAKDTDDDLDKEIKKKFEAGYPKNNILFQAPDRIVIYQDKQKTFDEKISKPETLIEGLKIFFEYEAPAIEEWEKAVGEFKFKVRELATVLLGLIEKERQTNKSFIQAFDDFIQLCQETINPNISVKAVEEMLIQHLLTERIFRKVFNNPDFVERNVIAHEIEKVISALTSQFFSRADFLKPLDHFYVAIENTAATIDDFSQKQSFLNTVYEKFFQGFSVKVADTHGIVYTPQPIVKFMVKSVEHILQKEFGRSLSHEGVHIIDPFVGTGNFILWVMREIQHSKLPFKYNNELHCNEVMLLPYYIASMNIEHEYYEVTGKYEPFSGICLVDTFDINEKKKFSLFTKENTARVKKQQASPIFVVLGNPPYNAGQVNENDNNKNRKYGYIDKQVSNTYGRGSKATLLRKLNDPYVKAIRWASDRIGKEGIVAFVTNSSFITEVTFDGMRKSLEQDFESIYILDLGGNVRKNPKLSGTTHNVFGIQVGVSINLLIKKKTSASNTAKIFYASTDSLWRKEEKYYFLNEKSNLDNVTWQELVPDAKHNWITAGIDTSFDALIPMGSKEAKSLKELEPGTIFKTFSPGVNTARDAVVYNFDIKALKKRVAQFCDNYNSEIFRYQAKGKPKDIDAFVDYDRVRWSSTLKLDLKRGITAQFDSDSIRTSLYRPFTHQFLYYDPILNERPGLFRTILPDEHSESENRIICINRTGERPFCCLMSNCIPNFVACGGFGSATECFPLFVYSNVGNTHNENITDWALDQFQTHYSDITISKQDIFNYIYAVLHHPKYREKYTANLKRELPRIPFSPKFWAFAKAGKTLADIHVNYEAQPEYKLKWIEDIDVKVNYRVDKMTLSKDKTQIIYNDFLTLGGIPPEVFEYRLGNRSALDWIIDQYRVKTDKRSGITNDPNNLDDPQYIIRLIGKVITVSLETMKIVKALPALF